MNIGDKLTKETYTEGALWCNSNNAHIEKQGNDYVIVANPTATLDEAKASKIAEFKALRDSEEIADIEYNGNVYDYDDKARERLQIARQSLADSGIEGVSIVWTTADNQRVTLTVQDFAGINSAAAFRSNALHIKYNELKDIVNACTTIEQVEAITWENYWENYYV